MNIHSIIRLPWRAKAIVKAVRSEVEENRRLTAELIRLIEGLDERQKSLSDEVRQDLAEEACQRKADLRTFENRLLAEMREQSLLTETAARAQSRAAAEKSLRERISSPATRSPGVSILIPCWNHAAWVGRAVSSALTALDAVDAPGEVVILDDGSRDETRGVMRELARGDRRIKLIESDANLGLPRARNVLLYSARFEHAVMLDSDNQLVADGIAALYVSALETRAVLVYGNIAAVDRAGAVLGVLSNEQVSASLLDENWIDALAMVRVERLIELGGYNGDWLYGLEDWELNLRLFRLGEPIVFVPVLTALYTKLARSMLSEAPVTLRYGRSARIFGQANESRTKEFQASIYHPKIGTLWKSPGWTIATNEAPAIVEATPARPRVLVVTSGGVLNYGDDAILLSTLERLRRIRPDAVVSVVSDGADCPPLARLAAWAGTCDEYCAGFDPEKVRRGCGDHGKVFGELSHHFAWGSAPGPEVSVFDVVLMSGGGNLNGYWPKIVARRAAIAAAANAANVPYILSGQGIGPLSNEIMPMLHFLIDGAFAIATRDVPSLRLLEQIAPDHPRLSAVGDDALGLACVDPNVARRRLAEIGVPLDQPLLAFQARDALHVGFSRAELHETAHQVDAFAAEHGYAVVAVPINMQVPDPEAGLLFELAFSERRRASWHIANFAGDVAAISGVIKVCNAVLTHSFHAAIFALESRVPTLLFAHTEYYERKAEALRSAFGVPVTLIAPSVLTSDSIAARLKHIAHSSWSRAFESADVDQWLDGALPGRSPGATQASAYSAPRRWSIAG